MGVVGLEFIPHLGVEVIEDLGSSLLHLLINLLCIPRFELGEGSIDLSGGFAVVEDVGDVLLEVEAVLDLTEPRLRRRTRM